MIFNVYDVNHAGERAMTSFATIACEPNTASIEKATAHLRAFRFVVLDINYVQHYASDSRDESGAFLSAQVIQSGNY